MTKTVAIISDGSKPLKNNMHERYAKFRAQALPRIVAFRKAGCVAKNDHVADTNSFRLERKPGVRERIEYLSRQAQDRVVEKRIALEEHLWSVMEADIADCFEVVEAVKSDKDGKAVTDETGKAVMGKRQQPKLLSDLSPDLRRAVEEVTIDSKGRVIPRLYSKLLAGKELRAMNNIGRTDDRLESDVTRLSDAELIQQLADQAKELGIEINLNYSFAQQGPAAETDSSAPVVDVAPDVAADVTAADAVDVAATAELKIAAEPGIAGARPVRARPKHR